VSEKTPTDAHVKRRGFHCLNVAFHFHTGDRYTHGISDLHGHIG
jgi:hypothetical protein